MADALPPHARPNLPIPERARRLELAAAQADRAEDRRRIIVEALEAAVAEPRRVSRREFRVLAATARASLLPDVRPETVAHQACRNLGWEVEAEPPKPVEGIFGSLTPDQRAKALAYDGPIESGLAHLPEERDA